MKKRHYEGSGLVYCPLFSPDHQITGISWCGYCPVEVILRETWFQFFPEQV